MAAGVVSVDRMDTRSFDAGADTSNALTSYLLLIDTHSSRRVALPASGIITLGRSPDADIRIDSEAVSRLHAKLIVAEGSVRIADIGSHNGTRINGESFDGTYPLASGDVVAIADTILVLRTSTARPGPDRVDADHLRRRIDQEIARATDYDRPFCVATLGLGARADHIAATASTLRPMDVISIHGSSLAVLLPELDPQASLGVIKALVTALGDGTSAGLASYPGDGGSTGALLAAARGALSLAGPDEVIAASSAAVEHRFGTNHLVIADPAMLRMYDLVRRLARSDISVLVTGETGTGKENAAVALHHWSRRAQGPLVALNCAALPEGLAESELFGHERGAFSDARTARAGLFERANGGTVFLDEVGDLSLALQAKVLRALEVRRICRLGDSHEREIDVRVVAATNLDLDAAVATGRFRQDLLYRLSGATVTIPALRHRLQEIPLLARLFARAEAKRLGRDELELAEATLAELSRYAFPGNVRELKNAMEYAVATSEGPLVQPWDLPERIIGTTSTDEPAQRRPFRPVAEELRDLERRRMIEALEATGGIQIRAAAAIGMPLRTFTFRMRQYGISSKG